MIVDTTTISSEYNLALKLHYKDALASRDITYKWSNELSADSIFLEEKVKMELLHAKNDMQCGSIEAAAEVFSRTIEYAKQFDSTSLYMAEAYARLGRCLNIKGESNVALQKIHKAKRIYEKHKLKDFTVWCDVLIADCYRQQEQFDKCFALLERSINSLTTKDDSLILLDAYNTYVNSLFLAERYKFNVQKRIKIGFRYQKQSLLISKEIGNVVYHGLSLLSLSKLNSIQKNYELQIENCSEASEIFKATNYLIYYVDAELMKARGYLGLKNYQAIISGLEKPIALAAKSGWFVELHYMYSVLAVAHSSLGNQREGAINGSRAFTIYKSIVNSKRVLEMEALEAKLEKEKIAKISEEKEKQKNLSIAFLFTTLVLFAVIAFLYLKLTYRHKKLSKLYAQKEILLKEVNHRVKNNLQMVSSLLDLQSDFTEKEEDSMIFDVANKRIKALSFAHETLEKNDYYDKIDLDSYLKLIVSNLIRNTDIKVETNIFEGLTLDIEKAQALGFVLNELILNSQKHAWKKHEPLKEIRLYLTKKRETVHLHYNDNGRGIADDEGVSIMEGTSLGFTLINSFIIRQLQGEYNIANRNGFELKLNFKA